MITQSLDVHRTAYDAFCSYLDIVMGNGGGRELIGLSTGYPAAGYLNLTNDVLAELSSTTKDGIEKLRHGYGWEAGSTPLRQELIRFQNLLHNTQYAIDEICMVAGASYGLNRVFEHIADIVGPRRYEAIILSPAYFKMTGRLERLFNIRSIVASAEEGFEINVDSVINAIGSETKAILLFNPTNPTHHYYTDEFLVKLTEVTERRGIYLVIDEANDAFKFDADNDLHLHRLPAIVRSPNVIRILSASKQYMLAEYRIGYVLADRCFIGNKNSGLVKLIGDDIGNAPLAATAGWIEIAKQEIAFLADGQRDCEYTLVHMKNFARLNSNRDMVLNFLRADPRVSKIIPPSANYNVTFQIMNNSFTDDMEFVRTLVEEERVALLPGSTLGIRAEDMYFRLTFALPSNGLQEGLCRLARFLSKLK